MSKRKSKLKPEIRELICAKNHKYTAIGKNKGGCPECRRISSAEAHQRRKQDPNYLEYHKTIQKKFYDKHGSSADQRLMQRGNRLATRYWPNFNCWEALKEYNRMLAEQEYCCKICEVHQEQYEQSFHVDHCHETGRVRGLLCAVCNRYVVGGIDQRAKAKKVHITKETLIKNILKYYQEPEKK